MLNPLQIVALNVLVTFGLGAVLMVAGMDWLGAVLWAWIGGAVITIYCAITLVAVIERRDGRRLRDRASAPPDSRFAQWEEDALDDAWSAAEKAARDYSGTSEPALSPNLRTGTTSRRP